MGSFSILLLTCIFCVSIENLKGRYLLVEIDQEPGPMNMLSRFAVDQLRSKCPANRFKCTNQKCIPGDGICNGWNDCGDNSDEILGCKGFEYIRRNSVCNSARTKLGDSYFVSDCAHKCIIKPGCKYFTWGNWDNGKIQGCFQEHTSSSTCPEGFKYAEYNFYQLKENIETPPCEDLEGWCKNEPKCEHEDVQNSCPKLCGTCEGPCEDKEKWCKYHVRTNVYDCQDVEVKIACAKTCAVCGQKNQRYTDMFVKTCGKNSCVCKGYPNPNVRNALVGKSVDLQVCAKACHKRKTCFGFEYWKQNGDHKNYANCFKCPVNPRKKATISAVDVAQLGKKGTEWATVYTKKTTDTNSNARFVARECRQRFQSCIKKKNGGRSGSCCPHLGCLKLRNGSKGRVCKPKKVCFNKRNGKGVGRCPTGWYCSGISGSCRKCAKEYQIRVPSACNAFSYKVLVAATMGDANHLA